MRQASREQLNVTARGTPLLSRQRFAIRDQKECVGMFRSPTCAFRARRLALDRPFLEPFARRIRHHIVPAMIVIVPERQVQQSRDTCIDTGCVWWKSGGN